MKTRKNNKGFSLVELIVVAALMVLVTGWLMYNASSIFGHSAKECHRKIGSAIQNTKIDTLSKSKNDPTNQCMLMLEIDSKGIVTATEVINGAVQEPEKLNKRRVNVVVQQGGTKQELSTLGILYIKFDRSTGEIAQPINIEKITVMGGFGKSYDIEFWPKTGKIVY